MIKQMKVDPTNEDYWFNNEIPEEWYKKEYTGNQVPETKGDLKRGIPFRVEYPVDKSLACKRLMGHPFILKATEQLLGTKSFIPTWDSMVFKQSGDGVPIKWHRDASAESVDEEYPAIDIGYYLDEANVEMDNCLWVIPGSHKWNDLFASTVIEFLSQDGFKKSGAIPVPVKPGDVILHNILVVHGSASCKSPLRRTVYYEYRAIRQELRKGPHIPEYIALKQKLLVTCLHERKEVARFDEEQGGHSQYQYDPEPEYSVEAYDPSNPMPSLRFPHKQYFRADYKG